MRYNPDTERGITLEKIDCSVPDNANLYPQPAQVWDCARGGWIANPVLSRDDELEGEAALSLWNARYKLQQIAADSIPAPTVASLERDVANIARELQRLS